MGKTKTKPSERNLANLVKWEPGQSGNPSGRPKKKPITDRYERIVGDAIALAPARQAIKGETGAAREIREVLEGRATTQDLGGRGNSPVTIIFDMPMPPATPIVPDAPIINVNPRNQN
jgi:hypothetical protein